MKRWEAIFSETLVPVLKTIWRLSYSLPLEPEVLSKAAGTHTCAENHVVCSTHLSTIPFILSSRSHKFQCSCWRFNEGLVSISLVWSHSL